MQEFVFFVDGQQVVTPEPEDHMLIICLSSRPRGTAVLLHKALTSKLLSVSLPSGLVSIVSCHLPHSGLGNEMWHAALSELEAHCTTPHLVIGVDANAVIKPELSTLAGHFVCDSPWNERSVDLAAFAEQEGLCFTNTYDVEVDGDLKIDRWSPVTWRSWNAERQIDFALTNLPFQRAGTYDICSQTDHRALQ
eukprot:252460-Amphidinium_carterae.3